MNLFQELSGDALQELDDFEHILQKTLKPRASHLKDLPSNIAELSYILTEGRDELARPYWSEARLKSAYLWYFMPWNLVRLAPLLAGLPVNLKDGDNILDLGSGPLTMPLALWLARPDLRKIALTFCCNDVHLTPLQSGLTLFNSLAGTSSAWRIELHKGSVREALQKAKPHKPTLISALNVLNEIRPGRKQGLADLLQGMIVDMRAALTPEGSLLLIEPGNRLGGKIIELARQIALKQKFSAISPCPHNLECPMFSPNLKTWCHFVEENPQSPAWLSRLSITAGLAKTRTALSFVLLDAKEDVRDNTGPKPATLGKPGGLDGRVVSNSFKVPGQPGMCRYACTKAGLALVPGAAKFVSGSLLCLKSGGNSFDSKTGALIATPI